MVGTARRMGNHKVSTRHMTYLIEVLFDHLSDNEKADFSQQLNVLTSRVPGDDSPITLPGLGGLILPPVSMYKVPKVNSFSGIIIILRCVYISSPKKPPPKSSPKSPPNQKLPKKSPTTKSTPGPKNDGR